MGRPSASRRHRVEPIRHLFGHVASASDTSSSESIGKHTKHLKDAVLFWWCVHLSYFAGAQQDPSTDPFIAGIGPIYQIFQPIPNHSDGSRRFPAYFHSSSEFPKSFSIPLNAD